MKALLATLSVVFLITFLATPTMGAGWFWDIGNALGFAAFGGLLYLGITSNRRLDVRAHQVLSFGVLFVAIGHAFWFLLGDAAVVEFVKPGAPDYMWLGIVGLVLLGVMIIVALVPDRMRVHKDYPEFRYWHRVVAIAATASGAYHILVSNFYLGTWYQAMLFVLVTIAALGGRIYWVRLGQLPIATNTVYILFSVVFSALFAAARNLPL
jgi:ferric reductase like protein